MKKIYVVTLVTLLAGCTPISSTDSLTSDEVTSALSESSVSASESSSSTTSDSVSLENSSASSASSQAPVHTYQPVDARYQPANAVFINSEEYYEFWDSSTRLTLDLHVSTQNIQRMSDCGKDKNDPRNDLYFPADLTLTMNGLTYEFPEIGMRMKGNTSRRAFAQDGTVTEAFSFKISFNEVWDDTALYSIYPDLIKPWASTDADYIARDGRTLFGMKKIDLKWNRSNDPSVIIQPFVYRFFGSESSGVKYTPRSTLSELKLATDTQDLNLGVYYINEPIDKTLIRRFTSKSASAGDLYKATHNGVGQANLNINVQTYYGQQSALFNNGGVYTVNPSWVGVENLAEGITPPYEIKTNEKTTTHQPLITLLTTLNNSQGKSAAEVQTALEAIIDMPAFLTYSALAYLTGNPDDLRNLSNNYYMYFDALTSKVSFIPYDYDWSLGVGWGSENVGLKMSQISPFHTRKQGQSQIWQDIPLYWYTILSENDSSVDYSQRYPNIATYRNLYAAEVERLFNLEAFSTENYDALFTRYRLNYQNIVTDFNTNSAFVSTDVFHQYRTAIGVSKNIVE